MPAPPLVLLAVAPDGDAESSDREHGAHGTDAGLRDRLTDLKLDPEAEERKARAFQRCY